MARIAKTTNKPDGVYAWLLQREEERARKSDYVHACTGTTVSYPSWRLEDLRAGRPVDVPTHVLPKWARTPDAGGRAVVHPDNTITIKAEEPGQWLDDNGLLFDETQAQAWARRHFDIFDMSRGPFTWKPGR